MKRIKTILISLAAIAATIPATRADEMSDLVAAVAASMDEQQRLQADLLRAVLGSGSSAPLQVDTVYDPRPRYTPSPKITASFLDGILSFMEQKGGANKFYAPPSMWKATSGHVPARLSLTPFFRPVPGIITSHFGWREAFHREHHGVDLALQIGDTVRCAVNGNVSLISYDHDGYGHYVVVSHPDGMETLYGHLQYPLVAQGQDIYAGQPIGIGGNTGNSTGPHLHFEARLGGIAVDPLLLFDFYGVGQYLYANEESAPEVSTPKGPAYSHQQKSLRQESTYIVRAGDTPESVARQAGISVMRLRQLNMLADGVPLPIGRMLKLR